jgi:uncharacterized protein (DUF1501 family)
MSNPSRRAFLQRLAQLGVAGIANPLAINLAAMGEAAAFNNPNGDYKALVCVFLYGGNDHGNTLIPYDALNYSRYQQIRPAIAVGQSSILPLLPTTAQTGLQWGTHPALTRLQALFHEQRVAWLQNVGTLIHPLTLDDYRNNRYAIPPRLFSHSDQQMFWQSQPTDRPVQGWGSAIGDLALAQNSQSIFTCITANGQATMLSGGQAAQYRISTDGAIPIWSAREGAWIYHTQSCANALRTLVTQSRYHWMEDEINKVTQRSLQAESMVSSALTGAPALNTVFNTNSNHLAAQLKVVARLISARASLGVKRQVFFVGMGGYDTHDNLLGQHNSLMAKLDDALGSFYQATVELGVAQQVTTFTASDFGRTLTSNGDGSDHGWGGHHLIMGGAVRGRELYGVTPEMGVNTAIDVGQGRWIPTTSVDQYAATLARWFGVSNSEMNLVVPNLVNFSQKDVGFMQTV